MPILDRDRRIPANDRRGIDVPHHTALRGNLRPSSDFEVISDAHLSAHHDAIVYASASGNANLGANHAAASNTDVVSNMHQIIENSARADHRVARCSTVYGAVGSNLNIILDDDAAELKHPHKPIRSGHKAEALRSDRYTSLDFDAPPDQRVTDTCVGADLRIVAQSNPFTQHRVGADVTSASDFNASADHCARVYLGAISDRSGGVHARSWINPDSRAGWG